MTLFAMTSKQDFEHLLDEALPFAKLMLRKEGEFIPFGAKLASNGIVGLVAGDVGEDYPKSDDVVNLLSQAFTDEKMTYWPPPFASWQVP